MKFRFIPFLLLFYVFQSTPAAGQLPLVFRDTTVKGPQTFAIIAGVSKYRFIKPLAFADKDAELFRDFLKSPGGGQVPDDNLYCILNDQVNNANFWGKGFQWLKAKQLQKGDRLFIYLAGHGDAIDEDQYFYLGYDCNPQGDKNNYLVNGAIQLFNLKKKIAAEAAKGVDVFLIMDACRSNELPGGVSGLNFLNTAVSEKKVGDIMMLATGAGQQSLEDASIGNGHGLFTWYLVDGLSGVADTEGRPDNQVTYSEIKKYVDSKVPSLALERFRRRQEPYFCCTENSEKVISRVDPGYLRNWLQSQKKSGGNSFSGTLNKPAKVTADTALVETYDKFNRALRANNITGRASADEYYNQLQKKYPGNPYTMDAKSSLAVAFINRAQQRVDRYLACADAGSAKEKQENVEAAANLEKAIQLVGEYDPDYAYSLRNQLYFLKASGDYGPGGKHGELRDALQLAYAALSIDRNGSYIQNKLAQLHLSNNRRDSALFYAEKAVKNAPNWACALTTLALVKQAMSGTNNKPDNQPGKAKLPKPRVGFSLGGALAQSNPDFSGNANSGFVGVDANSAASFSAGVGLQAGLGNNISVRPTTSIQIDNTRVDFQRRNPTGGVPVTETLDVKTTTVTLSTPFLFRLGGKKLVPYIIAAPAYTYVISQNSSSQDLLPLKKSLLGAGGGLGIEISPVKGGIVICPELTYTAGFSDMNEGTATTGYPAALSSLKRNSIGLSVFLRKK